MKTKTTTKTAMSAKTKATMITCHVFDLFNAAFSATEKGSFRDLNNITIPCGYLLHPDACFKPLADYISEKDVNLSATFYQSWADVTSKSRFELFIDQIRHYLSTYGTNFEGEAWLPERNVVEYKPILSELKVVMPITEKELLVRCDKMLQAGIALKQDTLDKILEIYAYFSHTPDLDSIRNREAAMVLYSSLGQLPRDPVEMVRYLVYKATTKSLLIKDKATIDAIKVNPILIGKEVHLFGEEKLASVFHRFKPLLLAFKKESKNRGIVNKLRKLAIKHHVPTKKAWVETLLSKPFAELEKIENLREKVDAISNFKKISLLQAIDERELFLETRLFPIRNGKVWVTDGRSPIVDRRLRNLIYRSLVDSLSAKKCKVRFPEGAHIALPASEKSFIGNFPIGTKFDLGKAGVIGIYWRGEDGARDIDLSCIDLNGGKIGWNSSYYSRSNSVIYSGDVTSANPDACEMLYMDGEKGFPGVVVKVNLFSGQQNSKFQIFFGNYKKTPKRGTMLDKDELKFKVDCEFDSPEKTLGFVVNNQFILAQFRSGSKRVSTSTHSQKMVDHGISSAYKYLDLQEVLVRAGFDICTDETEEVDIDFGDLSKDTMISLFS